MQFKYAFKLILDVHDQCGDRNGWTNLRDEAEYASRTYKSFIEWREKLYTRTDISQDVKWEIECFESSFAILFALLNAPEEKNKQGGK